MKRTLIVSLLVAMAPLRTHAQAPVVPAIDSIRATVARSVIPPTGGPIPAAVPPQWSAYLGEYGSVLSPAIVLENGGTLQMLFNGLKLVSLRPLAGDTFTVDKDTTRIIFTRARNRAITGVALADARLDRRSVGTDDGVTFRIKPLRPVADLRREALAATPPVENGDFLATDLVELTTLDPTIRYDIRYATRNNFMGEVFYSSAHAYMQRAAADALVRASARLRARGYGIVIHDAYRPWYVTKMFWDATPDPLKDFVADPASGSRHNRGAAVDMSLYDLATGTTVTTVSGYDEFSDRAYPEYPGGTTRQRWLRALLREAMEAEGFNVYRAEWWHFDYRDWKRYRIGNQRFEDLH